MKYKKNGLVCQWNNGHKMWVSVSVIITRRNVECLLIPLICCFQEGRRILYEQKISCRTFACFNLYCVRSINGNMKCAVHTGETVVQVAAVEVSVNHPPDLGPPKSILPGVILVIDLREGFEIVLNKYLRSWDSLTQPRSIEDINSTV